MPFDDAQFCNEPLVVSVIPVGNLDVPESVGVDEGGPVDTFLNHDSCSSSRRISKTTQSDTRNRDRPTPRLLESSGLEGIMNALPQEVIVFLPHFFIQIGAPFGTYDEDQLFAVFDAVWVCDANSSSPHLAIVVSIVGLVII